MNSTILKLFTLTTILLFANAVNAQKKKDAAEIERLKKELEDANQRARVAEAVAKEFKLQAEVNDAAAKKAYMQAVRLRYIAIAKAIAIKSIELDEVPEKQALLVQQAYKFNTKYDGYIYDNDIYNGLHHALVVQKDQMVQTLEGGTALALTTGKNREFYSGGKEGRLLRWTKNGTAWQSEMMVGRKNFQVYALEVMPDGGKLIAAVAAEDRTKSRIEVYDLKNPTDAPIKIACVSEVKKITASKLINGAYLLEKNAMRIRFMDLSKVRDVIQAKEVINTIVLSNDGTLLMGAGTNTIYKWDVINKFRQTIIYKDTVKITSLALYTDRWILVGQENGIIKVIAEDGRVFRELIGGKAAIDQMIFNPDNSSLATVNRDHTVRLWNWRELNQQPIVLYYKDQGASSRSAIFSPDGNQFMAALTNKTSGEIQVWPTKIEMMSNLLCNHLKRNLTQEEWDMYIAPDLTYESSCDGLLPNNK